MKHTTLLIASHATATLMSLALVLTTSLNGHAKEMFSSYVDAYGNISVPSDFDSKWVFLAHGLSPMKR